MALLTWTYQTKLSSGGNATFGIAVNPNTGRALVHRFTATTNSAIFTSDDGGVTWTDRTSTSPVFNGGAGFVAYNNGLFYVGSYPSIIWTTPDGVTWTQFNPSGGTYPAFIAAAGDGSNTVIIGAATSNVQEYTIDNGVTIRTFGPLPANYYRQEQDCLVWNGTQFVAVTIDSGGTVYSVFTAPSGFGTGGPVWTQVASGSVRLASAGGGHGSLFGFDPAIGYLTTTFGGGINNFLLSATPAGLPSATPFNPLPGNNTLALARCVHGYAFISDSTAPSPNFASSKDGITWDIETIPFDAAETSQVPAHIDWDPVHGVFILVGSRGDVVTASPNPTIAISPTSVTMPLGGTQLFTATTQNPPTSVLWSALHGTISSGGFYTAPNNPLGPLTDTVTVTRDDVALSASATVTLTIPTNPPVPPGPGNPTGSGSLNGKFRPPGAFPPVMLANTGTINPKIYRPAG
jgi:hypothetical protein